MSWQKRKPLPLETFQNATKPRARFLMSCSDADPMSSAEVLAMADPEMRDAWSNMRLSYGEGQGSLRLRQEAAKMHGVQANQVLVHVPQGSIYIGLNVLVPYLNSQHGLNRIHVISCNPAYTVLNENPKHLPCDIDFWNGKFTSKGWAFDLADMKALITERTRLLIINFPHNPTGFSPSLNDYLDMIDFCRDKGIFIFSDEMYMYTGDQNLPSVCSLYKDSVSLFGMAKTFGQPGLGIGWLVTQKHELLCEMADYKEYLTNGSPVPSEILATISLRNKDQILERNLGIINRNLDILAEFFKEFEEIFEWHRPQGGTVTLVKIKGWAALLGKEGGASGFCEEVLNDAGIMLVPSKLFGIEDCYVRLGFGRKDLEEGLAALRLFLLKHHRTLDGVE